MQLRVLLALAAGLAGAISPLAGARLRQDYPPEWVPIVRGKPVQPLDAYVNDARAADRRLPT